MNLKEREKREKEKEKRNIQRIQIQYSELFLKMTPINRRVVDNLRRMTYLQHELRVTGE